MRSRELLVFRLEKCEEDLVGLNSCVIMNGDGLRRMRVCLFFDYFGNLVNYEDFKVLPVCGMVKYREVRLWMSFNLISFGC